MTEAELALANAEESKERVEQIKQELHGHLENLRKAADEFVRELTAPAPTH